MNVYLRDSKTLQDSLRKDGKRNALPKAQLHPELFEAVVDLDSGSFTIASENPIDRRNMENFLLSPASCTASWVMIGRDDQRLPHELVFTFDVGGKLVLHTQAVGDVTKLTSSIPSDRTARFDASYQDGAITFIRSAAQKAEPKVAQTRAQMRVEAAKLGVEWDSKASVETMAERIEEARKQPAKA